MTCLIAGIIQIVKPGILFMSMKRQTLEESNLNQEKIEKLYQSICRRKGGAANGCATATILFFILIVILLFIGIFFLSSQSCFIVFLILHQLTDSLLEIEEERAG